ncbi:glycosyltransferase [Gordonia tangerina]|uniref:Glycosyltransferase n=1 Tax=Gordonia tangerina TaxID=2911060 RepID=A0ABS9DLS5_9ACTN|nr:glycosyltransferase [Gordonia tangerina]MCF3940190.1 glycosyltransferase [Gordonia tangerina]
MTPVLGVNDSFMLVVARPRGYKHVQVAAAAAKAAGVQLVVVGGSTGSRSASLGGVLALGRVDESELRWLYRQARALVALAHEDFGLTPIEAHAFGTPVVALRAGGYLDTVIEGVNGVFVDSLSSPDVSEGIRTAMVRRWDRAAIRRSADRFTESSFMARIGQIIDEASSIG